MRTVQRSALVPFSAGQMFALVEDIEAYPQFLPWCKSTIVHFRDGDVVEATLELQRGELSKAFRTRNTSTPSESIEMALVDGPFKHLHGHWRFTQLADAGSKVELDLSFEFASSVVDVVFGRFFEDVCSSLVEAFRKRAGAIYGGQ